MQAFRIIEIPRCRMASSGRGMFGDENIEAFGSWMAARPRTVWPRDFLYWDGAGFCWLYMCDERDEVPARFDTVDFAGGLYCVVTDIDGRTDMDALKRYVDEVLARTGFERDESRFELGNVITPPDTQSVPGYCQMDYYTPVKPSTR